MNISSQILVIYKFVKLVLQFSLRFLLKLHNHINMSEIIQKMLQHAEHLKKTTKHLGTSETRVR